MTTTSLRITVLALALAACASSATAQQYQMRVFSKGVQAESPLPAPPPAPTLSALGTLSGDPNFGTVVEGDSATRTFTFTNSGDAAATGVYAWLSDYPELSVLANSCGTSEAVTTVGFTAGANTCEMTLSFTPTTSASNLAGSTLEVAGYFTGSPQALPLNGTATLLTVSLASATLPTGVKGTPYGTGSAGYDLKPLFSTNSQTPNPVPAWSVSGGSLPAGLSLSPQGLIAGTPTAATTGAAFTVTAGYKSKSGVNSYTIVINGVTLEATKVSMGGMHGCAVLVSGKMKCWGYSNPYGMLGSGDTTPSLTPREVVGITNASDVGAGHHNTCAIDSGVVKCWGRGASGALGNSSTTDSYVPVTVSGLGAGVKAISVGANHVCAITSSGAAKCWGHNYKGKLGDGTTVDKYAPVQVVGLTSGVKQISAGSGHNTCAVHNGVAKCWGDNTSGALGDGTTTDRSSPVSVAGIGSSVTAIAAGTSHACALRSGSVYCWGDNQQGQLGNSAQTQSLSAVAVGGLSNVADLSSGYNHTCVLTSTGAAKCWGFNNTGMLGDGTQTTRYAPINVLGADSGVTQIAAGNMGTCARFGNFVRCWGSSQVAGGGGGNHLVPRDLDSGS